MRPLPLLTAIVLSFASLAAAALPPGAEDAEKRLKDSPRHGEWQDVALPGQGGSETKIKSWVVYPEKKDKAGVVIVIHEIFGLTDWVRSVADQLAADGFIAIAPDFLSGKGEKGGGTDEIGEKNVRGAIQKLSPEEVNARLDAVRAHAIKDPAANGKVATIGFCWGGAASFRYATHQPELNAAVVYYGAAPRKAPPDNDKVDADALKKINCPVLGCYASDDNRVNSTLEEAKRILADAGKSFAPTLYDGAGHGFLRQQGGQSGREANQKAAEQAWPATISFLQRHLSVAETK